MPLNFFFLLLFLILSAHPLSILFLHICLWCCIHSIAYGTKWGPSGKLIAVATIFMLKRIFVLNLSLHLRLSYELKNNTGHLLDYQKTQFLFYPYLKCSEFCSKYNRKHCNLSCPPSPNLKNCLAKMAPLTFPSSLLIFLLTSEKDKLCLHN